MSTRPRPRIVKRLLLGMAIALVASAVPLPAVAHGPPRTLAWRLSVGALAGASPVADPTFPLEYVGISWTGGPEPQVRFRRGGGAWTPWRVAHEDELQTSGARTFSRLVPAPDADAVQVRGRASGVRLVGINASDGPRPLTWDAPSAAASHLSQPGLVSRAEWGADEGHRFNPDGSEKWPPAFYETEKLIVHHTATRNADPDPAATVRAIYYYHAIERGFGDIGYNFLIDGEGRIYKGRYSGPPATRSEDTPTGEDPAGRGVTAAHTGGWNSGTMGIAVLGTYTSAAPPAAARQAILDHLAWEAERHGIDPLGTSTFTNPVNGAQRTAANISGHRDWVATECPGGLFYEDLPQIREDVAAKVAEPPSEPGTATYAPGTVSVAKGSAAGDPVTALADDDQTYYRVASRKSGKKHLTDWRGSATIDFSGATTLTVAYDGSASRTVTQALYLRNFAAGRWVRIANDSVSSGDETFTWSTTDPSRYISGSGEVRLRVRTTRGSSHTARGDLMRFTVEH